MFPEAAVCRPVRLPAADYSSKAGRGQQEKWGLPGRHSQAHVSNKGNLGEGNVKCGKENDAMIPLIVSSCLLCKTNSFINARAENSCA